MLDNDILDVAGGEELLYSSTTSKMKPMEESHQFLLNPWSWRQHFNGNISFPTDSTVDKATHFDILDC